MFPIKIPRFTFWRSVFLIVLASGLYSTYLRFTAGLGASTALSDGFPWGLWIGFDVLCGVALAAGGFTISAVVYVFNIKRFKPIIRPSDLDRIFGLSARYRRAALRSWPSLSHLAPASHVEPTLGDVRGGLVRDAIYHCARFGIQSHLCFSDCAWKNRSGSFNPSPFRWSCLESSFPLSTNRRSVPSI